MIEVPGVGDVPGEVVRAIAGAFGSRAVVALADWRTGVLASETRPVCRPPAWLGRLVRARDLTCRFPGCTVPAARCDVDHVLAAPRGPTELGNLMCLCRHHHRIKQQPRWRVAMTADGVVTWTTPVGDRFTTWPVDHLGTRDLLAADAAHPAGAPAARHSYAARGHPARAIHVTGLRLSAATRSPGGQTPSQSRHSQLRL